MITVKNVTQYTVAPGVALSTNNKALLSQLKEFSRFRSCELELTRESWAKELGIDVVTVRRWERNIIRKLFLLGYFKEGRKNRLDEYQRFILSLIWVLKVQRRMTYDEIVSHMVSPSGQPFWMTITREKFSQINNNHSQKAG